MFLDKTVLVEILGKYAGNNYKESYIPHYAWHDASGVPTNATRMNIQPASAQMALMLEGQIGKVFNGFTSASGIVESMRVTISGTNQQFIVRGRQNYDYGPLQHSELILFKRDPL